MPKAVKKTVAPKNKPVKAAAKKKVAGKPVKKAAVKGAVKPVRTSVPKIDVVDDPPQLEREVVYPKFGLKVFVANHEGYPNSKPMTEADARKFLGWEDEEEASKLGVKGYGSDYFLTDENGIKVRLRHNTRNRMYYPSHVRVLISEILNRRWKFNGESMIIGRTGMNISCQHRLIALVLATQIWRKDPDKWPMWDEEPTIECYIAFGVDESDDVVDTVDTGKPRSLADVLYRSDLLVGYKESQRKTLAKMMALSLKVVAGRTGAWVDAYAPKRTPGEEIDFLNRHPSLLNFVKDIYEESDGKAEKTLVPPGIAAGLYYLMATSATKPEDYVADIKQEGLLDFSNQDLARLFWVDLMDKKLTILLKAFESFTSETGEEASEGTTHEKIATIVKAWQMYSRKKALTTAGLQLQYHVEDGLRTLCECPTVGGVDAGNPEDSVDTLPPEPKELSDRKEAVKAEAQAPKPAKKKAGKSANGKPKVGDMVYVVVEEGVWYGGELMETFPIGGGRVKARINVTIPKSYKGKTEEVEYSQLVTTEPQ